MAGLSAGSLCGRIAPKIPCHYHRRKSQTCRVPCVAAPRVVVSGYGRFPYTGDDRIPAKIITNASGCTDLPAPDVGGDRQARSTAYGR